MPITVSNEVGGHNMVIQASFKYDKAAVI